MNKGGFTLEQYAKKQEKGLKRAQIFKAFLIGFGTSLGVTFLLATIPTIILGVTIVPFDPRFFISTLLGLLIIYAGVAMIIMSMRWSTWAKLLTVLLTSIIGTILVVGGMYIATTLLFFKDTSVQSHNKITYSVVVKKDSGLDRIVDLTDKKVDFLNNDGAEEAMNKLSEYVEYNGGLVNDMNSIVSELNNGETQATCLESGILNLSYDEFDGFKDDTKIIFSFKVDEQTYRNSSNQSISNPFVVYISGIDQYGDVNTIRSRSDVNQLVVVNPKTHKILLVNTPRDYYVQLADTTGLKDKLTHAGIYGIEKSIKTMEQLYGIEINYYVRVNFDSLVEVVDTIGGVDIVSDRAFRASTDSSVKVEVGLNHFNGKQALGYARERYSYESGDRHRGENQQQIITAIIEKMTSSKVLLSNYNGILASLSGSYQTDMPYSMLVNLLLRQLDGMPKWSIESISVDGTGSMQPTYSMGSNLPLYVMVPDEVSLQEARSRIAEVIEQK